MNSFLCASKCVYHADGCCVLNSADSGAVDLPALGGACVHVIPADATRLGLPHRYCAPGSNEVHGAHADFQRGVPESGTV